MSTNHDFTKQPVEWLSPRDASRRFSISRSALYVLLGDAKIKTCVLRRKGAMRGKRLISAESVNALLESLAKEEQS